MNEYAYSAGKRAAFAKFGGSASAGPVDYGSPVATTHHRDSAQNISQNFRYNASLSDPSSFTQPSSNNSTMQGGTPTGKFKSDTSGGLSDS
jgi:hypothetical protein